jgi:hypothetical protein
LGVEFVTKCHKEPRNGTDSLDKLPKLKKMDTRGKCTFFYGKGNEIHELGTTRALV